MAKSRLCFSIAGYFGAEMAFESSGNIDVLWYSAEDVEIITPEEYDMVFGGDGNG